MNYLITLFSLSLLLGCGQAPSPIEGFTEAPSRKSNRSACYQGPQQKYDACLETEAPTEIRDDYSYPDPFTSDFPSHRNPYQYIAPSFYINLAVVALDKVLAPNFLLSEFLSPERGQFGIFSPQVLDKIQAIRDMARGPVHITSGYRSPGHNSRINGAAKWSRHMYGDAVDFFSSTVSLDELMDYCKQNGASFYQKYTTHVHCDWRDLPLPNAFYEAQEGLLPPRAFNSLKAYRDKTKIQLHHNKSTQATLTAIHPQQEDEGELVYEWTVRDSKNKIHRFSTREIRLDAQGSPYDVELKVGGSLVVHRRVTW